MLTFLSPEIFRGTEYFGYLDERVFLPGRYNITPEPICDDKGASCEQMIFINNSQYTRELTALLVYENIQGECEMRRFKRYSFLIN